MIGASVSRASLLAVASLVLSTAAGRAQVPPHFKCDAAKLKCAEDRVAGLLACHAAAETKGVPVDPACLRKVSEKYSFPERGCVEKAEAKPPCLTVGDGATVALAIDAFVDDVVRAVDPTYPDPVRDRCSAGKKKCVARKTKALLRCHERAIEKGRPVDPECVGKAQDEFDGGSFPAKGCVEKLEAKYPPADATPCRTVDDTAALGAKVDVFTRDVVSCSVALPAPSTIDFTLTAPRDVCGEVRDAAGNVIEEIACGTLTFGNGFSPIPSTLVPTGARSRFALACPRSCPGGGSSTCTIGATTAVPPVNTASPDCTDTGCSFGTPLPTPNPAIPALSTCFLNTWSRPASGTIDLVTGQATADVALAADIYLTGNVAQPCPRCSAGGTPSSPGTGVCDRGPRAGLACTTTNDGGLTRDCLTGGANPPTQPCVPGGGICIDGAHIGVIAMNLSPLTTAATSKADPTGRLCPGQFDGVGCFGLPACRRIDMQGTPAGPITSGSPAAATLVSVFCVPRTGSGIIDAAIALPGPGAVALSGRFARD